MKTICFGIGIMMCHPLDQAPQPASAGATFCQLYQPVYWSAQDTRETKEQVDRLNRKWKAVCRKAAAK